MNNETVLDEEKEFSYKEFNIRKKSGKFRKIVAPSKQFEKISKSMHG